MSSSDGRWSGQRLESVASRLTIGQLGIERAELILDQQDSGCVSSRVEALGVRWFVKTARTPTAVETLENALRFHDAVDHPAIVRPVRSFRSRGLTLVYPWVDGRVLNHATAGTSDRHALEDFRRLPIRVVNAAIAVALDAHRRIAARGFVAVDFYDGCLLYDFESSRLHLIDLDEYRRGPFTLTADRLPGSRSYMAPEEFERGATISERTTVFNLGRMIHHLCDSPSGWRGSAQQAHIVRHATEPDPDDRYGTVAELQHAWNAVTE